MKVRKSVGLVTIVLSVLLALAVLGGCPYGSYPKELIAEVISDGDDTYVAYELERSVGDHDVHLQKLDDYGEVLWDETLFKGDDSRVGGVGMVAGNDGVLVVWEVYLPENGGEGPHDFDHATLASVDDDGDVRWRQDFSEQGMQVVADGGGGVVMAWPDGGICYACGVDSQGDVLWEETVGSGYSPQLVWGEEGAVILRNDQDNHSFLVQKLDSSGQPLWGEGVVVEYSETAFQLYPQMVSDGMGGAIVAWIEESGDQPPNELRLQRIFDDGQDFGSSAIGGPLIAMTPNMQAIGDELMGITIIWEGIGDGIELRLMRNNPLSSYLWPPEGVSVCSGLGQSPRFEVASDGRGGVVVIWVDGDQNLYAQRLDSVGQKLWGDEGVLVAQGACGLPVWVAGDSYNGFVVGWTSGANFNYPDDSYIRKINAEGIIRWGESGVKLGP